VQEDPSTLPEAKRKRPLAAEQSGQNKPQNGKPRAVPLRTRKNPAPPIVPVATTSRNHIRFSSTSPPPALKPVEEPVAVPAKEATPDEESDDDAAPEAISKSTAQAESRATQAEAFKADRERKNAKKARRRKRDRELKQQVQGSEKRKENDEKKAKQKRGDVDSIEEDEEELVVEDGEALVKLYSLDNLPALLPDELLATEAPIRPPTPPTTALRQGLKNERTTFTSGTAPLRIPHMKPPTDLTVGEMKVRVMAKTNPLLPPKASDSAKSLREGWLKGRRAVALESAKGRRKLSVLGKVQRRAFGGSSKLF
jgi:U3 small nucleolar RNA-associated protein 16